MIRNRGLLCTVPMEVCALKYNRQTAIAVSSEVSVSRLFSMPERSSVSDFIRDTARGLRNDLSRDGTVMSIE